MSTIKVTDVAYGRLRAPDLDVMEEFLTDFGMVRAARTSRALYMRGTDPHHHIHVTELGEPGFVGLAWHAADEEDLHRLARLPGASAVEAIDEPGGGLRVRIKEPNGYQIEVVHGIEAVEPIPVQRVPLNMADKPLNRAGELVRLKRGAARVKRIGHCVMGTPDLRGTVDWFRKTLGLICTDEVYAGSEDNVTSSFNRCDRGEDFVDHHIFYCVKNSHAGLNHLSFEVQDVDDVFLGQDHLRRKGKYEHMWGVGRHLLGSQIFDYWADPWGRMHEHWTDSDRLNIHNAPTLISVEDGLISQWGDPPPEKFIKRFSV
ncbi:VOC family protein [Paraburkholderia pallida]|uniref:Catechol 1,2-dioxygenase n=1 Tax=Paraburkholderia pallida TaxID=2547399 RepID=A0A4P7CSZ6_9BURK|nr:VOC family protein [Paraburkholderia pallida]QBQ99070.1 catechol 1,2-dioxygenase [Paraburkholderia pallida]